MSEVAIRQKFPRIFEMRIGCVPAHFTVKLQLRKDIKPKYFKERDVPFALRQLLEIELEKLQREKIISPIIASDWGSPLVLIPKADDTVRTCVDYKMTVNKCLVNVNYPIRRIDEIINSLCGSRYFCRLDLYKAYLHIPVDDSSAAIQTITTHKGTFKMHRLSYGIKVAPAEFNRIIDQILRGLSGVISYFDNIVVHGATKEQCFKNLLDCLQRLHENDLHLNT